MNKKQLVKRILSQVCSKKGHHVDAASVSGAISRLAEDGYLHIGLPGGLGRAIFLVDLKPIARDPTFVLASCDPGSVARMENLVRTAEELARSFNANEIDREADRVRISTFGLAWIVSDADSHAFKSALEQAGFDTCMSIDAN